VVEKMGSGLTHLEYERYSRHLLIPEVGLKGQEKLKESSVLIVGTGGLGSPVSSYLAAAGVGRIGIVDFDKVELSNLQRQVIHGSHSIGESKVVSAKNAMLDINQDIQVDTFEEQFTSENALRIANNYDILIDGSDNFPTRYLSNDVCVLLGIPNIFGSVFRFDGQASVFYAKEGPCYRCLFPEPPPAGLIPSCADGGVLGILPGTIGTIQATEAIKLLLGIGSNLIGRLLLYDALEMTFDFVKIRKNPECRICGDRADIHALVDYEAFCGSSTRLDDMDLSDPHQTLMPEELSRKIEEKEIIFLLDVREPHELEISRIKNAKNIPLGQLPGRLNELNINQEIVIFCKSGHRSRRALEILYSNGIRNAKYLKGGINEWARIIDPSLPVY
jgi:adenylyltransferase/sulfurtransferase